MQAAATSCAHPSAPGLAGDRRREDGRRRGRQRGRQPEGERRAGREPVHRPADERDDRRLIGVAERRVRPGDDEVELVAVEAVTGAGRDQHQQLGCGDDPDQPRQTDSRRRRADDLLAMAHAERLTESGRVGRKPTRPVSSRRRRGAGRPSRPSRCGTEPGPCFSARSARRLASAPVGASRSPAVGPFGALAATGILRARPRPRTAPTGVAARGTMSSQPCRPSFVPEPASWRPRAEPIDPVDWLRCRGGVLREPDAERERQHPRLAAAGPDGRSRSRPACRAFGGRTSERWRGPPSAAGARTRAGVPSVAERDDERRRLRDPERQRHGRPAAAQDHRAAARRP